MGTPSNFLDAWCAALLRGETPAAGWYAGAPSSIAAHAERRRAEALRPLDQAETDAWAAWLAPFDPPKAIAKGVRALRDPAAVVVATGQQAGIAGGPLFTIAKAVAAARWARRIESETGKPAVAVFWIASDDHDFDEVASASWIVPDGSLRAWSAGDAPAGDGRPVYEQPWTPEIARSLRDAVARDIVGEPHAAWVLDALDAEAARPSASWESQFAGWLVRVLGPLGVVPLAPRMPWLRRRAAALLAEEARRPGASTELLIEAGAQLEALGAKGLVLHRAGGELNFFRHGDGARWKLRAAGGALAALHPRTNAPGPAPALADLPQAVLDAPEQWSPNAALRPLAQDLALPTAAYVGGPSEVLYHAQLKPLYQAFGVFRPLVVPRPRMALVEHRTQRALRGLGLSAADALAMGPEGIDDHALRRAGATGLLPLVEEGLGDIEARMAALEAAVKAETNDTWTRLAAERLSKRLAGRAEVLRARARDAVRRRGGDATRRAAEASAALWPGGSPQERAVGWIAPLLARHGPQAVERLADAIDLDDPGVQAVEAG